MNRPVKIPIRLDPAMPLDVVELRGASSVAWIDLRLGLLGWDNGRGPRVDNLPRATPEEGTPA